ncbi:NUDIX hydrolase [Bradyrhizobium sp. LHD-71]|uniref:NUDIX hydrolase n=1 Tax=Bradyrhizobium sp. LHD-71 TaxID=3072141 RepID=UPI00280CC363|nr:NUDIX hydrolase [Bradyrhizobium sp. LHD-71]MDQ8727878.1 NUDIX hydrolase [Bradyrhizobium sp. LHD-71]
MKRRRIKRLELSFASAPWPFADEWRAEIDAHFARVREAKPEVWNGRLLLCRNPRTDGDCYRADYFETDFASFLAWRDWGFPDKAVFNSFGAGALRSVDGAFVLGRMNAHTANAGRVYFPAGTPDPDDIVGQSVDLALSVEREMEEEVGLKTSDYVANDGWTIIETGQLVACFRLLASRHHASELQQRIEAFLTSERLPELSDVIFVRSAADFDAAMPEFVKAFLEDAFGRP